MGYIAWGYSDIIDIDGDEARDYSDQYYFAHEGLAKACIAVYRLDYSEVSPIFAQCGCLSDGDKCEAFDGKAYCQQCI